MVAELIEFHPDLELAAITTRDDSWVGRFLHEASPEHRVKKALQTIEGLDFEDFDAAVVAYPPGSAARLVRELREADVVVVDSCADFRFRDLAVYEEWYEKHEAPELIDQATYGLPEVNRDAIANSKLIGNPGCYPTATVLGLAPLAREGLIEDLVVDAKSGASGKGKRGTAAALYVGTDENMKPYGIDGLGHRHEPEITEQLSKLGYEGSMSFVPYLIPLDQGELVSCYVKPTVDLQPQELVELYETTYGSEVFVELTSALPGVREVRGTNICRLHARLNHDRDRVLVFAAIDNLWKGGASQAMQNLNIALGIPEDCGIPGHVALPGSLDDRSSLDRPPVSA
jgi:N-acetyl-gamma-glutamyl-phosphate reductase